MTFQKNDGAPGTPAILAPQVQQAVWFMGALVRVRASGENTAGCLDVLEHKGERGYSSPLHRHLAWFLTVHVPGGFDRFTLAVGTPATGTTTMPPEEVPPDPAALAAMARSYGIEILGPPLAP